MADWRQTWNGKSQKWVLFDASKRGGIEEMRAEPYDVPVSENSKKRPKNGEAVEESKKADQKNSGGGQSKNGFLSDLDTEKRKENKKVDQEESGGGQSKNGFLSILGIG